MFKKTFILIIFVLVVLSGCGAEKKPEAYSFQAHLLGTDIVIDIEAENAADICNQIFKRIEEIQDKMTIHNNTSEITQLNAGAGMKKVHISADTYFVLNKAINVSKMTGGAFDPTVGPLVKLWSIGSGNEKVPGKEDIQRALALVDFRQVQLENNKACSAYLPINNQVIDLGGVAKGYAGDEAKMILLQNGIKRGIINLGGNIMAVGRKADGSLWRVGIQNPLAPQGTYIAILQVEDKAVVTSGGYERYFMEDGKRYHHIIDPQKGYPAESGLLSVTIISDKGILADALSTGVYVLGLQKGMELINSLEGVDAIFISDDKKIFTTRGIQNNFEVTDGDFSYETYK